MTEGGGEGAVGGAVKGGVKRRGEVFHPELWGNQQLHLNPSSLRGGEWSGEGRGEASKGSTRPPPLPTPLSLQKHVAPLRPPISALPFPRGPTHPGITEAPLQPERHPSPPSPPPFT